MIILMLRNC